mgnify:CR=1 FL=1|tara:strand:- start:966 stop:2552 length:1587 start_codon:yes stop_codon:yes gene_type:complete
MKDRFKRSVIKIYNSFQSFTEIYKNKDLINAYKEIINLNKEKGQTKYKKMILDGGFYNLGYQYRLQLLRSALKLKIENEHAFIWDCNIHTCKNFLKSIGIKNISYLKDCYTKENKREAEKIAKEIDSKSALINYTFPDNVPGLFLYDVILKGQKSATLDIKDKNLSKYIFKFISSIKFSKKLINSFKPDIIALSHGISYQCAPIAWLAAKKGIPVIILYGEYGVPRLWRLNKPEDIFYGIGHPIKENIDSLKKEKIIELTSIGEKYLSRRLSGSTKDIGGKYAFQNNKDQLDIVIDKTKHNKVIAIYLGNWFDFPHIFGMSRFIDIFDWITKTIKFAAKNKNVFWIIKPHPMDDWYGGLTLKDVLKTKLPKNVIILRNNYSGKSVIEKSDGLITYHGTSAIEFAAMGKPVMVTDKGWYHDCGFVKFPKSKKEYLKNLGEDWFFSVDVKQNEKNAKLFAGLYFGIPLWQKNGVLPDDADRKLLRTYLPRFIKNKESIIKKEIKFIKSWIDMETIDYHTYKMNKSKRYTI